MNQTSDPIPYNRDAEIEVVEAKRAFDGATDGVGAKTRAFYCTEAEATKSADMWARRAARHRRKREPNAASYCDEMEARHRRLALDIEQAANADQHGPWK